MLVPVLGDWWWFWWFWRCRWVVMGGILELPLLSSPPLCPSTLPLLQPPRLCTVFIQPSPSMPGPRRCRAGGEVQGRHRGARGVGVVRTTTRLPVTMFLEWWTTGYLCSCCTGSPIRDRLRRKLAVGL